jgi:hypothetical protein
MSSSLRFDLRPGVTEPVVLLISRREVDAGDIASVLSRLKVFLATRQDAWRYRGQMTLVVDGYNSDARELVDIPEVRALLCSLEAEWPYWAYFFNQVDDSIKLLLSCVAGSRFLGRGAVEMDADLVAAALARAFGGMNMIFERFGFPEDELEKYTLKALPGKFSGLHLLAIMYTAFRQIDPTMDTGADFSAEYQAALQMQKP